MDSGASALIVGKRLACKLGVWKRARKVKVKQGDGTLLNGNRLSMLRLKLGMLPQCWINFQWMQRF